MFSNYLSLIDEAPAKTLLFIAALLVIACQLVAIVMVAGAQVEKAELREASQASARAASFRCMKSSQGAALKDCFRTHSAFSSEKSAAQARSQPQSITLVTSSERY